MAADFKYGFGYIATLFMSGGTTVYSIYKYTNIQLFGCSAGHKNRHKLNLNTYLPTKCIVHVRFLSFICQ